MAGRILVPALAELRLEELPLHDGTLAEFSELFLQIEGLVVKLLVILLQPLLRPRAALLIRRQRRARNVALNLDVLECLTKDIRCFLRKRSPLSDHTPLRLIIKAAAFMAIKARTKQ